MLRAMNPSVPFTALMASQPLPSVSEGFASPYWVHLLPAPGSVETVDGRGPYQVRDPSALIAASFASGIDLPVDENHSIDLAGPVGNPSPARGWIKEMESRADGIWGRVEWNAAGADLVTGKAYRAISPVIFHDAAKTIHSILRASLVNRPNIRGLTALHQQQDTDMTFMQKLAAKLGLPADATEEAILAAIGGKAADKGGDTALQSALTEIGVALGVQGGDTAAIVTAAKSAKVANSGTPAEITALQSEIATLTTSLNAVTEAQTRAAATTFVDAEIKKGRAGVKPLRDHYIAMHMADAARVEKEIGAMPVLTQSGTSVAPPAAKDGEVALNAEQLSAATALGIDPKKYAETLKAETGMKEAL